MNRTETLNPTNQKSFYGKAKIIYAPEGILLKSYATIVAMIDNNGEFVKLWCGYSATTMKHINAFCDRFGYPTMNKATWVAMTKGNAKVA